MMHLYYWTSASFRIHGQYKIYLGKFKPDPLLLSLWLYYCVRDAVIKHVYGFTSS